MNKNYIPTTISNLSLLEKEYDVVNVFKYKNTLSWINIKNYLYSLTLNGAVSNKFSKRDIVSKYFNIETIVSLTNSGEMNSIILTNIIKYNEVMYLIDNIDREYDGLYRD